MIKVKTKVGDVGLVELNVDKSYSVEARLVLEQFERFRSIGKLSQLDKELEEFVEFKYPFDGQYDKVFRNYLKLARNYLLNSAKESFISLLQSEGIDTGKEYLIIRIL